MKYIAIILLVLLLFATICGIVLRANMPTARLTVHAVRPMGTNRYVPVRAGEVVGYPVWEFAVTNKGRLPVRYISYVAFKDTRSGIISPQPFDDEVVMASLRPSEGVVVYMAVWPDSNSLWAANLLWWSAGSALERKLNSCLNPPWDRLRFLLPNDGRGSTRDAWHSTTNVATAR